MKYYLYLTAIILLFAGCAPNQSPQEDKLYVVTTTGMITDVVRNLGGKYVRVDGLMGPGVDPHAYKATASDSKKLAAANVIIYNGLHLEGKMANLLHKLGRQKPVYTVTEDIPKNLLQQPAEFEKLYDPHIWFDVSLWIRVVRRVSSILQKIDPKNSQHYQIASLAYQQKLETLHAWVKKRIAEIPKNSRVLVTAHDAFGYFGRAYEMEVIALQGISTVAEYGIKDVERLAAFLVDRKIRAVFVESSVPRKSIEAVIAACRAQQHQVTIGGSLFSDAMGSEGTKEGTYIGMVEHNVNTIVDAILAK